MSARSLSCLAPCAQVLEMRERTLGAEHAEVAGALNNLAVLLKSMGRFGEAQALYEKSIRIKEKALGPAHPQVLPADLPRLPATLGRTRWPHFFMLCARDAGPAQIMLAVHKAGSQLCKGAARMTDLAALHRRTSHMLLVHQLSAQQGPLLPVTSLTRRWR